MPTYIETFGERVREVMKERGLSPYEVERRSEGGISHQTVRNMIRSAATNSDHIVAFAEAVEETPETREELANELLTLAGRRLRFVPAQVGLSNTPTNGQTGRERPKRANRRALEPLQPNCLRVPPSHSRACYATC
jgi:hypothetical protein